MKEVVGSTHPERSEPTDGSFSTSELEKLQSGDQGEKSLAIFLASRLDALYKELQRLDVKATNLAHLCEVAADNLQRELRDAGFDTSILEGDIEQNVHDWLEHQINLVKLPSHWVVIDLTARQLPWLKDRSWLLEIISPDTAALKKFLKDTFRWWIS